MASDKPKLTPEEKTANGILKRAYESDVPLDKWEMMVAVLKVLPSDLPKLIEAQQTVIIRRVQVACAKLVCPMCDCKMYGDAKLDVDKTYYVHIHCGNTYKCKAQDIHAEIASDDTKLIQN